MTAASILILVQVIAAIAGTDWTLFQFIEAVKKDGGIEQLGKDVLALFHSKATPDAMDMLKVAYPSLHTQAQLFLPSP